MKSKGLRGVGGGAQSLKICIHARENTDNSPSSRPPPGAPDRKLSLFRITPGTRNRTRLWGKCRAITYFRGSAAPVPTDKTPFFTLALSTRGFSSLGLPRISRTHSPRRAVASWVFQGAIERKEFVQDWIFSWHIP